jgi:hypothetical protein
MPQAPATDTLNEHRDVRRLPLAHPRSRIQLFGGRVPLKRGAAPGASAVTNTLAA